MTAPAKSGVGCYTGCTVRYPNSALHTAGNQPPSIGDPNYVMDVLLHPVEIQTRVRKQRSSGQSIGVVPTMGALHEGHLSLIEAARAECDFVVTTIFVNPTQFSPTEDLKKYPRPLEADLDLCRSADCDLVFTPSAEDMYSAGRQTTVAVSGIRSMLEGVSRPTHFDGVTTVVAKLFNITLPDRAYFGQKDYQQQLIIRQMVHDLNWPLEVVTCPIVREADGLAMSSRNRYLSVQQREQALCLNQILNRADVQAASGQSSPEMVQAEMLSQLQAAEGVDPDYAVVVDPETLQPAKKLAQTAVGLLAARVGNTRLIDNRVLTFAD